MFKNLLLTAVFIFCSVTVFAQPRHQSTSQPIVKYFITIKKDSVNVTDYLYFLVLPEKDTIYSVKGVLEIEPAKYIKYQNLTFVIKFSDEGPFSKGLLKPVIAITPTLLKDMCKVFVLKKSKNS